MSNLDCTLNQWKGRNLSLKGKVFIVKTLGLSKFIYLSKVLHVPDKIKHQINKKICIFIWNGQTEKVNRKFFMQHYITGGYSMHDFDTVDKPKNSLDIRAIEKQHFAVGNISQNNSNWDKFGSIFEK